MIIYNLKILSLLSSAYLIKKKREEKTYREQTSQHIVLEIVIYKIKIQH